MLDASIVIGTRNPAKRTRLAGLLDGTPFTPADLPGDAGPDPEEGHGSHAEIALAKAIALSRRLDRSVICSDGGASIAALGDAWQSELTRRAAGPNATDLDRARHLLDLMRDVPDEQRGVEWTEAVAIANRGRRVFVSSVRRPLGVLVREFEPRHIDGGFWMNGLIVPEGETVVLNALDSDVRDRLDRCWAWLRDYVADVLREMPTATPTPVEPFAPPPIISAGSPTMDEQQRFEQGRDLVRRIWGPEFGDEVLQRFHALSPDLERQIVSNIYGDLWSREGPPDLKTRSLMSVCVLTALHRPNQLRFHLVGALNNGATEREIVELILNTGLLAGFPTSWDALIACNQVFQEYRDGKFHSADTRTGAGDGSFGGPSTRP